MPVAAYMKLQYKDLKASLQTLQIDCSSSDSQAERNTIKPKEVLVRFHAVWGLKHHLINLAYRAALI